MLRGPTIKPLLLRYGVAAEVSVVRRAVCHWIDLAVSFELGVTRQGWSRYCGMEDSRALMMAVHKLAPVQ